MFKRLLPFLIILLLAVPVVLIIHFTKGKTLTVYHASAIEMVPDDPIVILESRSVSDLVESVIQSAPLFPALEKIQGFAPISRSLICLDTVTKSHPVFQDLLDRSPALLSVHPAGKDIFQFVLVLDLSGHVRLNMLGDLLQQIGGRPGSWKEVTYDRERYHQISFADSARIPVLSVFQNKKYLVLSPSQILVENVIRLSKTGNPLTDNPSLKKLIKTAGIQSRAELYVNLKEIPQWWSQWMNSGLKKKMTAYNRYGSWVELDLTVRNDGLLLSGLGLSDSDQFSFLDVFKRQEPQPVDVDRVIPASAGLFIHYGIQKPLLYFEDLTNYLGSSSGGRKREQLLKTADRLAGENVEQSLAGMMSKDLVLTYLTRAGKTNEVPVVMAGFQSRNQISGKLIEWLKKRASEEQKDLSFYRSDYQLDREKSFAIYRTPFNGLPELLGGPLFAAVKGTCFGFVGNFLILADKPEDIQMVIYYFELNKVLSNDPYYQLSTNWINSRSSFTLFAIPMRIQGYLSGILNPKMESVIKKNQLFLQEIGAVGLQFHYRDGYYHNLFIRFSEMKLDRPHTVWESHLEGQVDFKPAFVINHYTRAKEIVIQDEDNNLYLINGAGRILWRVPLEEQINSGIYQIDFYKNNKLQLLFSTPNYIHLIDRKGNYVDRYPIKLRAPATNGLNVFDYDANKDYRFIIACSDHRIYLYDKQGSVLKGWGFDKTEGTVRQPAQHFRIGTRDYIVFSDEMRVYILNRRGSVRVQPKKQFPVSTRNRITLDPSTAGKGPRWVITDAEGTIYSIYLDGTVSTVETGKFSYNHFFTVADLNQDGRGDYIYADDNRLEVFDANGKHMFNYKFNGPVEDPINVYRFSASDVKIGVVVKSKNDIYLFNRDGTLYKGFPLRGRTQFSIGFLEPSSKHFNLVVGSENQFLYNYRVK